MRGVSTARGEACTVNVYVDGASIPAQPGSRDDFDRLVRPADLAAVEAYSGGAQVPLQVAGASARCVVIALRTRSK